MLKNPAQQKKSEFVFADILSSLVVFLVALPLSLGIAIASGVPVRAGLIAAVCGGIVVGLLGGAPLQVSGPAAGLTVIVYALVQKFGVESVAVIAMAAGAIQVLLGLIKAARLTLAASPSVIHAMLAGIGILIALGQFHVLLGFSPGSSAIANLRLLPEHLLGAHWGAVAIGLTTLAVIIGWNRWVRPRVPQLPGALPGVVVGTLLAAGLSLDLPRVAFASDFLTLPSFPTWGGLSWTDLLIQALTLALVASAESLLCAVATDRLHSGKRANLDRELLAQGAGNLVSGFFGGLPVTGVIVRSSANVSAGARTRLSAILHAVWILVFVLAFGGVLRLIPLAALAALLVHTGVNLVKMKELAKVHEHGEGLIYAVTLMGVVFNKLLWGIGIGFALSLIFLLYQVSRIQVKSKDQGEAIEVSISGALTFLSVPSLIYELNSLPPARKLKLSFEIQRIDLAAIETIRDWKSGYERTGGTVQKESLDRLFGVLRT